MTSAATGCDDRRAMPIYDHRLDHCGHSFSQVQSYSDEPVAKCPNCGKKPRRLIASTAVVFRSEERRVGKECRYRWVRSQQNERQGDGGRVQYAVELCPIYR